MSRCFPFKRDSLLAMPWLLQPKLSFLFLFLFFFQQLPIFSIFSPVVAKMKQNEEKGTANTVWTRTKDRVSGIWKRVSIGTVKIRHFKTVSRNVLLCMHIRLLFWNMKYLYHFDRLPYQIKYQIAKTKTSFSWFPLVMIRKGKHIMKQRKTCLPTHRCGVNTPWRPPQGAQ